MIYVTAEWIIIKRNDIFYMLGGAVADIVRECNQYPLFRGVRVRVDFMEDEEKRPIGFIIRLDAEFHAEPKPLIHSYQQAISFEMIHQAKTPIIGNYTSDMVIQLIEHIRREQ